MLFRKKKQTKIDLSKDDKFEFAYKTKQGISFYKLKNILEIPANKALSAERACRFAEINLTEKSLKELIKKQKLHLTD